MRIKIPLIIAAGALLAATPALAQNEGANATEANATAPAANEADMMPADSAAPVDENATLTTETTTTETTAPVEPVQEKKGFPWGVLGLLGLLGLIPRLRRG